jgi:hypothetical protein
MSGIECRSAVLGLTPCPERRSMTRIYSTGRHALRYPGREHEMPIE